MAPHVQELGNLELDSIPLEVCEIVSVASLTLDNNAISDIAQHILLLSRLENVRGQPAAQSPWDRRPARFGALLS